MSTSFPLVSRRYVGQVKWFNNKAGFGFITMMDDSGQPVDIFTHYSTVLVADAQYKYLVQGEYVEFELMESTNTKHAFQAANITGINGGNLMCETRQLNRPEKNSRQRRDPPILPSSNNKDMSRQSNNNPSSKTDGEFKKVVTNRQVKRSREPKGK